MEKAVKKEWGRERWLVNNELYCAKLLHVKAGYMCSLHRHKVKDETFMLLKGDCLLEMKCSSAYPGNGEQLRVGDTRRISPGTYHRFSSVNGCTLLEVSTHHSDDDVERIIPSGPIPQ